MTLTDVTRELLVRYLGTWVPGALHGGRRATFALASRTPVSVPAAEAALRVFAEFADRLRGRELTMIVAGPGAEAARERLAAVQAELRTPAALTVHTLPGDGTAVLPVALQAARAAGAPLLVALDGTADAATLRAVRSGKPGELLLITEPALGSSPTGTAHTGREGVADSGRPATAATGGPANTAATGGPAGETAGSGRGGAAADGRAGLRDAGFALDAAVELVDGDGRALLVCLGTPSAKSLEAFKNELWAVDEYAGVRLRDPHDPDGGLLDISLTPNPAPLRRELLDHLAARGPRTVTELKHFTMTDTVYRPADTVRALHGLLDSATVTRDPEHGRLGGDVVIARARASGA
ncbi:hypothetical protein J2S43_003880 [Catenuloplanes nepalensis]|uniref:Glucose-6-phosphate isomerase n=1 Tax=Catenuloplanes nepalensis TaxID=587533 RepID=A0ABT9MV95_9ACTN|nr:hypothetical protein [Catenuloplanes nepalensis]MDP9795368.1 hypothetical protein [Catenuloplanes nepalensis]